MKDFKINLKSKRVILALGAESAGNFSIYTPSSIPSPLSKGRTKEGLFAGTIHFSQDFGDLADENNFSKFKNELLNFIKKLSVKPDIILHDLHPLFRTTQLAEALAKKYGAEHMPVQHHLAHVFSAIGDKIVERRTWNVERGILGIACDGTGYAEDGTVWGGEIFKLKVESRKSKVTRVGHLENQILIGGEIAIKEPARVLISILSKFLAKDEVFKHVKKYYSKNEFELLFNQLEQKFNCLETSSTARVLDAVSVLLGFSKNERFSKHGPVALLEQNSSTSYNLKPVVEFDESEKMWILKTTPLFEYIIKNLDKDKKRLAATAQAYLANGLERITENLQPNTNNLTPVFFAGGMANNKIISSILKKNGVYISKKIPSGDAGISLGQILYWLIKNYK